MKFCTYFDHNYLPKAITLYRSLCDHLEEFTLFALCLSPKAKSALDELNLPGIIPILLEDLEAWDRELFAVKSTRSTIEYYFTLTPSLPLYIFEKYPDIDWLHYLDSDLYFFQSPELIMPELENKHCGITPHDFSPKNISLERYGKFNVGLVSWRNTVQGRTVLDWYRARCIEWCYDSIDGDRFADQKYLDKFESLFEGVHAFTHKGINVAPWNLDNRRWSYENDVLMVDSVPLIFFHFHGLKEVEPRFFNTGIANYDCVLSSVTKKYLFLAYLERYKSVLADIAHLIFGANLAGIRYSQPNAETILWLKLSQTGIEFNASSIEPKRKSIPLTAVVADYETPETLSALLADLVLQTISHAMEIVVVGSGEITKVQKVIDSYLPFKSEIVLVNPIENETPYHTWSRAVRESNGIYLVNVVGGYRFAPTAFEEMVEQLTENEKFDLVYGDSYVASKADQSFLDHIRSGYLQTSVYDSAIPSAKVGAMSGVPMWKHSIPAELGWFCKNSAMRTSYSFWKMVTKSCQIVHVPAFWSVTTQTDSLPEQFASEDGRNFSSPQSTEPTKFAHLLIHESSESPVAIEKCLGSVMATTRFPHVITVSFDGDKPLLQKTLQHYRSRAVIRHLDITAPMISPVSWIKEQTLREPELTYTVFLQSNTIIMQDDWLTGMIHVLENVPNCEAVVGHLTSSNEISLTTDQPIEELPVVVLRKESVLANLPAYGHSLKSVRAHLKDICTGLRLRNKTVAEISIRGDRASV